MKKQSLVLFSISSLFVILGVAALHAQTFDHEIRANVPFRFMVGNQTLPAGAYRVTRIDDQGVLLIKSSDSGTSAIVNTHATSFKGPQNDTALLFNRYGDHYFLSQVWTVGEVSGEQLPKSKMEREVAMARNDAQPDEQILIAGL